MATRRWWRWGLRRRLHRGLTTFTQQVFGGLWGLRHGQGAREEGWRAGPEEEEAAELRPRYVCLAIKGEGLWVEGSDDGRKTVLDRGYCFKGRASREGPAKLLLWHQVIKVTEET